MRRMIYADNAATTKLDIDAFEAMRPYLLEDYANPSQPYFFSKKVKYALKDARKTIAECIGANPEEINFFWVCPYTFCYCFSGILQRIFYFF